MKPLQKSELKGYIFEIQKLSTEDGPGIRTTVFFKECPLRCIWCHNPESLEKKPSIQWFAVKCIGCLTCVEACPNGALRMDADGLHIDRNRCKACGTCAEVCPSTAIRKIGEYIGLDELMAEILKDKVYYEKSGGGVTASGGEAAIQAEFVAEFFKRCKEEGIHTALDLCGILPFGKYEIILPYTDLFLYDIKEIDPIRHKEFTGVSNERILENAVRLAELIRDTSKKMWIRTPVIPRYTATEENIRGIGRFIVEKLGNVPERWDLLAFNNLARAKYERMDMEYKCADLKLLTAEEMEYFKRIASSTGVKNVQWSGLTARDENTSETETKKTGLPVCGSDKPFGTGCFKPT